MEWIKDPTAELDWTWDWSPWLGAGEAISTSSFVASPGITVGSGDKAPSKSSTSATIWLSGGIAGTPYKISNTVTTNQGRTNRWSITIKVDNK